MYASRNKTENLVQRDVEQYKNFNKAFFTFKLHTFSGHVRKCNTIYVCGKSTVGLRRAVCTKLTFSVALCLYLEQRILHSRKINVENVGGNSLTEV